ncbi:unnamed protein product [Cercopithifilaria johnstoni]|uniref:Uncharacterized protein n=1 Tax=Cercopithifilaria johnstoni TaxID=2874296 RepID=A0A8J2LXX2_9BILA|nr:unnamed protein product [Cercopithifilaria johnstoni]
MERSVRNIKQILRENVAYFLEHADGREVIVNVTARLVKKQNEEQKRVEKDIEVKHSKRNFAKHTDNTLSQVSKITTACSWDNNSVIDWYGKGKDRYHYSKE